MHLSVKERKVEAFDEKYYSSFFSFPSQQYLYFKAAKFLGCIPSHILDSGILLRFPSILCLENNVILTPCETGFIQV